VGSLLLYLAAAGLAYFHPHIALAIIALVTVIWILPGMVLRH
jgi:hypothetical protein